MNDDINEQLKIQKQIAAIEELGKRFLSKEAISRYGTLKMAYPEVAFRIIAMIAEAAETGQLKETIDDEKFKDILKKVQSNRKETRIRRI